MKEEKSQIDNNVQTMHINTVPQYLCDTIANFRKNAQYNTRNEEKYLVPKCRLAI